MSADDCGRGSARESVAAVDDRRQSYEPSFPAVADRRYSRYSVTAAIASASVIILFIVSCSNLAPPPQVSSALVANARPDHADANVLATGRKLFVSRCLECHTLPSATKHSRDEWPHLVTRMSGRANLSASERDAITAYLRAASVTVAAGRQE